MEKRLLLLFALFLIGLGSCKNERLLSPDELRADDESELKAVGMDGLIELFKYGRPVPGKVIVQVTEDMEGEMSISESGDLRMSSVPTKMQATLTKLSASKMKPLFTSDPRFVEREREMGMHLWYEITIDDRMDMAQALREMSKVPGVVTVEYHPEVQKLGAGPRNLLLPFSNANYMDRPNSEGSYPFNDPRLRDQWHYHNTGSLPNSKVGADVNLFRAWAIETGKSNVIVSVVDGGIDVTHQDLKANLWVNKAELDGKEGVDDDNNGYIDDIYGYNFAQGKGDITPDSDSHGTHVAGTVAAVNNNSTGVCGVAGGDGTEGSGVRLMSGNVFAKEPDGKDRADGFADAIKYGADNGAVISQNSWGSPVPGLTPDHIKLVIDYFRKYAGCDKDGNQLPTSPMKGGVVIVASGNSNSERRYYPAEYEPCITVNAMAPDFTKASYSNYGTWTDIMAPGGDMLSKYGGSRAGVLSTIVGNDYTYYNGTSMACPHVSGIAALVVSKKGGPGFTAEELESILMASLLPVDINEMNDRKYAGKLGAGYIDAYAALTIENRKIAPEAPKVNEEKGWEKDFTSVTVSWAVPKDEDDLAPHKYQLFYSEKELTKDNYREGKVVGAADGYIHGAYKQVGDEMEWKVSYLVPDTEYHFALKAIDRWGLESKVVLFKLKTKKNLPPVVTNMPTAPILLVDVAGKAEYDFNVEEPDGHSWKYEASGTLSGVFLKPTEGGIRMTLRPVLGAGDYSFKLKLIDELGGAKEYEVPFLVVHAQKPALKADAMIPAQITGVNGKAVELDLSTFFEPQKNLEYTYKAEVLGDCARCEIEGSKLSIFGVKPGRTTLNVEVSNGYLKTVTDVELRVVKEIDADVHAVWPQPVRSELNIWLNKEHKEAKMTIYSVLGEEIETYTLKPDQRGVAKVRLAKVAPGNYKMRIVVNGRATERFFLKV